MDTSRGSETMSARDRDKYFVGSVESFISNELSYLYNDSISRERFLIFKQAFNKIMEYVQSYKHLLGSIKKEYELCIDALEKGQMEAKNFRKDLQKMVSYPSTLFNLQRKYEELKIRAGVLKNAKNKLVEELNKLILENDKYRPKKPLFEGKYSFLNIEKPKIEEVAIDDKKSDLIPGLDLEEATDLKNLNDILQKVDYKVKEMNKAQSTQYSSKLRKQELQSVLSGKIVLRDTMQQKTDALKHKAYLYRLAINAAKDYYSGRTQYPSIQEALSKAIINGSSLKQTRSDDDNEQMDELSMESEAEYILDYIEKFNELFENGKHKEAAYFAAASPKAVLRNIETLYRFKTVSNIDLGSNDPLLLYCNAILDSISDNFSRPDASMSLEFIKCVLLHEKLDMLTRWIAQKKLMFSYEAAKAIEDYVEMRSKYTKKGLELALFIYREINACFEASLCMIKLGRIKAAVNYISSQADKLKPDAEFYLKLLNKCPEIDFANALVEYKIDENVSISVEQVVSVLLDSDQPYNGLQFMKLQLDKISKDFSENLDEKIREEYKAKKSKLKTSYETLCKFSFLTQNDDQFTKSIASESRDQMQQLYSRLGNDRPMNASENSVSLERTAKSTKSDGSSDDKISLNIIQRYAEEKIDQWSLVDYSRSEFYTDSHLSDSNLKRATDSINPSTYADGTNSVFTSKISTSTDIQTNETQNLQRATDSHTLYPGATNSIISKVTLSTELPMVDESSKLTIESSQRLHNNFYNNFNQEIFDDEDLN